MNLHLIFILGKKNMHGMNLLKMRRMVDNLALSTIGIVEMDWLPSIGEKI